MINETEAGRVSVCLVLVIHDTSGKILLQVKPETRMWALPECHLLPRLTVLESAVEAIRAELAAEFTYQEFIGAYSYLVKSASGEAESLLLLALSGTIRTDPVGGLEIIGRRFFAPRELPGIADRAHLDILTDYLAGRRGILR